MKDHNDGWSGPNHWTDNVSAARDAFETFVAHAEKDGILTDAARAAADRTIVEILLRVVRLAGNNTRARQLLKRVGAGLAAPVVRKN